MRDLYSVLQVAPNASAAEIKSAFRSLAKTCHPDVRPGDPEAEQTFQEAKRAYQYLSNPESRKIYDAYLARRRAAERTRRRRAATTMSATFLLTSATVVLVTMWLHHDAIPVGRLVAEAIDRNGASELARAPVEGDAAPAVPAQRAAAVRETPARP